MESNAKEYVCEQAKKTFLALQNPYGSVKKVFPLAINTLKTQNTVIYVGVKDHKAIPVSLLGEMADSGMYILHTLDASALGGRAVDMNLKNPITGNYMTGSSSGTALNVFLGINDIGVGTDGGGSVLAPAMSLQLFGFISPLLKRELMLQFAHDSTEGLTFVPSLGYIARDWELLKQTIELTLPLNVADSIGKESNRKDKVFYSSIQITSQLKMDDLFEGAEDISFPELDSSREVLISFLNEKLPKCDYFISYEGPVDVRAMGDTVFGHFDEWTSQRQKEAGKGFIRVANMACATAICIPGKELGYGYVLMCESIPEKIIKMLVDSQKLIEKKDDLITKYFGNLDFYFNHGYGLY